MKFAREILSFILVVVLCQSYSFSDEGMYPISDIASLDLKKHGLELTSEEVFNPNGTSLIDGICRVNGCTGSFVSPKGLIITNHHCAYRAIQSASSAAKDLLKDGFSAKSMSAEIPAPSYTVRITESYRDISDEVLSVVEKEMDFVERTKAIDKRRKELEKEAEEKNPEMRAEIGEMFAGKSYVLFLYTYIKDVRLVFAPPASVGAFGGDVDNWEWPRHTGDFAFMRAYVAPDGSSAEYSADNVPYKPKRFIEVAPEGVDEEDYVMLLGYPGRTARHKTAAFLQYEENVRLPYIVELYQWQIKTMLDAGANNREVALKHASREKSLANVEKRSRGQLKGLKRAQIVEKRLAAEKKLQDYINKNPARKEKYGNVLAEIEAVYKDMERSAKKELNLTNLRGASRLMSFAFTCYDAANERKKPDLERETPYMDRNWELTKKRLILVHKDLHIPTDKILTMGMFDRVSGNDSNDGDSSSREIVERLYKRTQLHQADVLEACLEKTPEELEAMKDSFINLVVRLYPTYMQMRENDKKREGRLGELYGKLIDVKQEFMKSNFVPDANATLRLTFGNVRGYSPHDAVTMNPITTLAGVVNKTTGVEPFVTPQRILDMHAKRDFGRFEHPKLKDVPTAILYDTDTTGGNSGSPILDSKGRLVGVNFDRAFEATINDFAWNESYSRSIGVDIRYALWITGKVFGATNLLEEMGVK